MMSYPGHSYRQRQRLPPAPTPRPGPGRGFQGDRDRSRRSLSRQSRDNARWRASVLPGKWIWHSGITKVLRLHPYVRGILRLYESWGEVQTSYPGRSIGYGFTVALNPSHPCAVPGGVCDTMIGYQNGAITFCSAGTVGAIPDDSDHYVEVYQ